MAVWKLARMESGAQSAMIIGILMTQMRWVVNLASLVRPPLLRVHHTVWDQVISGWKMSSVKEQKPRFSTVATYLYRLQITGFSHSQNAGVVCVSSMATICTDNECSLHLMFTLVYLRAFI